MSRPREFDEEEVLEAAMDAFRRRGFEATSVADLTEAMGIGKASLYASFGDKQALYTRALRHYQALVRDQFAAVLAGSAPLRERVTTLLRIAGGLEPPQGDGTCLCVLSSVERGRHDAATAAQLQMHDAAVEEQLTLAIQTAVAVDGLQPLLPPRQLGRVLQAMMQGLNVAQAAGVPAPKRADIVQAGVALLG